MFNRYGNFAPKFTILFIFYGVFSSLLFFAQGICLALQTVEKTSAYIVTVSSLEDISISRWIISGFLSGMPPMSGLIAQGPEKNINKASSIHGTRIHSLTWQILYYVIFVSLLLPFIFLLFIGASVFVMVIKAGFVFSSIVIYHISEISQCF